MRYSKLCDRLAFSLGKPLNDSELLPLAEEFIARYPRRDTWCYLADYGRIHKVVPQVYANARRLSGTATSPLSDFLSQKLESEYQRRLAERERIYPEAAQLITKLLAEYHIPHLFIKGAQLASLYEPSAPRQSNDIDLMVPDVDALFAAATAFTAVGFEIDFQETPWIAELPRRSVDDGGSDIHCVTGHITVKRRIDDVILKVDIHVQNMPINDLGDLPYGQPWDRAREEFPSFEDALLILVSHAVNHGFFIQKDINDLYLLFQHHGVCLDWDYIVSCLTQSGLVPMFKVIWSYVQKYANVAPMPADAWRRLNSDLASDAATSAATWLGPYSFLALLLVQGTATYLIHRSQGRRIAWSEAWRIERFLIRHRIAESSYQGFLLGQWLKPSPSSLLHLCPGQRVNLVNAEEVWSDEAELEPTAPPSPQVTPSLAPSGDYEAAEFASNATVYRMNGAELLALSHQWLVPTDLALFTETDAKALQYLHGLAPSMQVSRGATFPTSTTST